MLSANFGISTYKVSSGLASEGVSVIRFNADLAFIPKGCLDLIFQKRQFVAPSLFILRVMVKLLNETTWWTK